MVGIVSLSEAKSTLLSKGHGHFIPTVVLLFVQVMFAANTIVVKAVLEGSEADPLFFLSCRAVIAVICLFLLASHSLGWKLPWIDADLHVPLMLLGFFGVVGNQVLFIYGLDLTSPTVHGIVQPSVAVWTMAICVAMGYERLTGLKFVGLLASVVGSIIVILSPKVSLDQPSVDSGHGGVQETQQNDEEFHSFIMGVAMLLLHTLSYAIYLVRQKEVLKKLHPTVTALYTFAYGGAGEIILASKSILALDLSSIETSFWFAAFYAGFVTSGIGYFLSMWVRTLHYQLSLFDVGT
eukprot:TRINITY_DN2662_c0_g1_i3.p1 TRINITY_DN2662_c0_g1~~TRINITY_DN2662_c0_g1_i3.p1  ORF type:complete len:294 (-),score=60.03 TRINITY_DN2662_c0_g1_i3:578-1459(-)